MHDRGQSTIFALIAVALAVSFTVAAAQLGTRLVHRNQARAAADAAALAGVIGGHRAAASLAARNGGHLLSYRELGDEVTVVVEVAGETAQARATDGP